MAVTLFLESLNERLSSIHAAHSDFLIKAESALRRMLFKGARSRARWYGRGYLMLRPIVLMLAILTKRPGNGNPFNIASYALLTLMVAQVTGLKPGDFVHTLGDAHIYHNHFDQARLQLTRTPKALPKMEINPAVKDVFSFTFEDFTLVGYEADSHIKAPVAV